MSLLTVTPDPAAALATAIARVDAPSLAVITDSNVARDVLPLFRDAIPAGTEIIVIPAGEQYKNIATLSDVWRRMSACGLTRRSLVVNIGGGVVTDLGGFAAATFKRGIRHINVATTLLGAVDAAAGGKTAIDLDSLKNEVGAFHQPLEVIISTLPFATLPRREMLSGYAEMVKTALLIDDAFYRELLDADAVLADAPRLEAAVRRCVEKKLEIVAADPEEKGLRKVLNLGHTAGHAIETLSHLKGCPMTHGEAVAHGLAVTLALSHELLGLDESYPREYVEYFLNPVYDRLRTLPSLIAGEADIDTLIRLMGHDKKNARGGQPSFVLLSAPGEPVCDVLPPASLLRRILHP